MKKVNKFCLEKSTRADLWRIDHEKCWCNCSKRGGSCPTFCGNGGYCCSSSNSKDNGDCPESAVQKLKNFVGSTEHICVYPSYSGESLVQ